MLTPKRVKWRKVQRGRMTGAATRGNSLTFGDFGLQAAQAGWLSAQTIEAGRGAAQQQAAELLSKAGTDAQKVIDDAKAAAKSLQEREAQRATMEAEQIVNKARDAAKREHTKMLAELKREVARLVISTTSKVTGKILTDDDQKRLSDEAGKQIAA